MADSLRRVQGPTAPEDVSSEASNDYVNSLGSPYLSYGRGMEAWAKRKAWKWFNVRALFEIFDLTQLKTSERLKPISCKYYPLQVAVFYLTLCYVQLVLMNLCELEFRSASRRSAVLVTLRGELRAIWRFYQQSYRRQWHFQQPYSCLLSLCIVIN